MAGSMKVNGSKMSDMGWDLKDTKMGVIILDNSNMEKRMEKVYLHGSRPGKSTMANGLEAIEKDKAFGETRKETLILENGKQTKQKALESTLGQMATDTKGNGKIVSKMEKGKMFSPMEISLEAHMSMENLKAEVFISGKTVQFTKETSKED